MLNHLFSQRRTSHFAAFGRFVMLLAGCLGVLPGWCGEPAPAHSRQTFYIDSEQGQDSRDGLSAQRAWQSLDRVSAAALQPGDTVRFKCGGQWRGALTPTSGDENAPVTYTSFGTGAKPLLLGSVPRNRATDWVQVSPNLWATLPVEYQAAGKPLTDLQKGRWNRHQEAGARVDLKCVKDADGLTLRFHCTQGGSAANHVQLWGPELPVTKGQYLVFTFRARSSLPLNLPRVDISQGDSPWTRLATSRPAECRVEADWKEYRLPLRVLLSADVGRLHISLGQALPPGAVFEMQPQSLVGATPNIADPLSVDVGNVIFDEGAVCGWKKWSLADLKKPYDYYYEPTSQRVYVCSPTVPTAKHRSIELALARHIVHQGGKHHVIYDGLALKYGAAHGFGGSNTHHLVIRNCDLGYIGGAHQFTRPDGKPVRFGNAIEFWGAAHDNLVEGCRIWEVYDAALTNQGRGPDSRQINITYRNNLICNAEYSFEYWNNPETAVTQNIRFLNNTCVNAGTVWSHAQRPDRNGSHLMFYTNTAATAGIEVKYNIFYNASDWGSRYSSDWKVLPDMDYNLWFSQTGVMVYWFREKIGPFDDYRRATGLDAHSQWADPHFIDAAHGDYRLAPDSPARKIRSAGGSLGADLSGR